MSQSRSKNEWENRYQKGDTGWDRGQVSDGLYFWLKNKLLQPCRILVPGCGNGYEVLELAKRGFEVTAIDIAPTAINNLQKMLDKNNLSAKLVLDDFFNWKPEMPTDAIYEQTSLCALPPDLWQRYEERLYDWLTPGGKLYAQFMQTGQAGGPPFHCALDNMHDLFKTDRWKWSNAMNTQTMGTDKKELQYLLEKI